MLDRPRTWVLWLLFSGCSSKSTPPAEAAVRVDAVMPDAEWAKAHEPVKSERPQHPGIVAMVNHPDGGERQVPVAEVPESIAWGLIDGRPVPVVRVVRRRQGITDTITRYGPGLQFIDRTTRRRKTPGMPAPQRKIIPTPQPRTP